MHDIKFIRNDPEKFKKQMLRRDLNVDVSSILQIDKVIRTKSNQSNLLIKTRG